MVNKCCMPHCRGNYANTSPVTVYRFPKDPVLKRKWLAAIQRENFEPTKHSRVCHLHFEPSQIVRETSGYDPKTGRTLTAPLYIPRLRKDAVPTLCLPPPGTLVKKTNKGNKRRKNQPKEEPVKVGTEKDYESQLDKSLQTVLVTESENIAEMSIAIKQEPIESIDEAPQLVIGKILNAQQLISSSCISSTSSSQSSSSSPVISTPPSSSSSATSSSSSKSPSSAISTPSSSSSSSISTPPSSSTLPAIGTPPSSSSSSTINSLSSSSSSSTINLLSSRSSSAISSPPSSSLSSAISKLPFPLNASPITNHHSTNMNKTPGRLVSNKQGKKRKANDAEPDADDAARCATQAKFCHRTKPSVPSKKNGKPHPPAGTSKKSAGRSNLQTENDENATREMFQSLFNGSENSPLRGLSTSERPEDLFDVFAAFVADKLREMDWDDCAYALRAILDLVFKTGKAKRAGEAKIGVSTSGSRSRSSDQE